MHPLAEPVTVAEISPMPPAVQKALEQSRLALEKVFLVPGLSDEKRIEHARAINRGVRKLEYIYGVSQVASRPAFIELPVAGKCNLRCEMCGLTHGAPSYSNWTIEEVERLSPILKYADWVNPTGAGEPLLVKDFFKMLTFFKKNRSAVGFYTNATLLTADKVDELIALKIDVVNVSIDGATKETFERIRKPAKFETVVDNVKAFIKRRDDLGAKLPRLRIAMVLMQSNMHELGDLLRFAKTLGADEVYTMFVSDILNEQMPEHVPARTNQVLREGKKIAQEIGISFFSPSELPERLNPANVADADPVMPAMPSGGHSCSHPWNQFVVWNDGAVSPCCRIRDHVEGEQFGNIKTSDSQTLWNSPGFVRIRERLAAGKPPKECQRCPLRSATIT